MDILKLLGTALAWVSGVVAGVTAILYALGFAASVAHQRLLGVDWGVISREPLWYLGVGGQVLVAWLAQAMVVFFIVVLAGEAVLFLIRRLKRLNGALTRGVGKVFAWVDRHIVWLIAFLAMFLTHFLMQSIIEAVRVRNLLLGDNGAACEAGGLRAALLDFDEAILLDRWGGVALLSAMAIGVGAYALPRLAAGEGPALPLLICIAVAANAVISVPVAHGIFRADTRWPSVSGDGEQLSDFTANRLRLLGRTPDGLWAWEPEANAVHLFVQGTFDHLRIGPETSIRQALNCQIKS